MRLSVTTPRKLPGAIRRALPRCLSSTTNVLPKGIYEISCVPRVPSWSLKELHREGTQHNAEDLVLTEKKLLELAEMCHLHLDDKKIPGLLKDVESIIQCIKTIQAITRNEKIKDGFVTSDYGIDAAPLRDDIVTDGDCVEELLANAAIKSGFYFKVPKVLQE